MHARFSPFDLSIYKLSVCLAEGADDAPPLGKDDRGRLVADATRRSDRKGMHRGAIIGTSNR